MWNLARFFAVALVALLLSASLDPSEWQNHLAAVSSVSTVCSGLLVVALALFRAMVGSTAKAYIEGWARATGARERDGLVIVQSDRGGGRTETVARLTRDELNSSLALRVDLRKRFGVELDLGTDSPEFVRGVKAPLVEWTPAEGLPAEEPDSGEGGAYRSHGREHVARYVANEKLAAKARRTANVVTTVADEAAIAEERLFVREEADVAFIALADLRDEERDLPKGGTTFVFGRATRIAFLNEDNDVVRALRHLLGVQDPPAM